MKTHTLVCHSTETQSGEMWRKLARFSSLFFLFFIVCIILPKPNLPHIVLTHRSSFKIYTPHWRFALNSCSMKFNNRGSNHHPHNNGKLSLDLVFFFLFYFSLSFMSLTNFTNIFRLIIPATVISESISHSKNLEIIRPKLWKESVCFTQKLTNV